MENLKKVFMFANYTPADGSIGITKKIRSEISALRKMGKVVTYTAYDGDGVSIFNNDDNVIFHKKFPTPINALNRKIRYYWLENVAFHYLKTTQPFDLGYIRMSIPNGLMFEIFKQLKTQGAEIIAETLAYFPGIRYKSLNGKYIMFSYKKNSDKFKEYVSYFLVEGNMTELHNVKAYTMNMGVEVDNISLHNYEGDKNSLKSYFRR